MESPITIATRLRGLWQRTPNGGDIYIGGEVRAFSVDKDITYEQFMHIVYGSYGINPAEETIIAKAIFLDITQVVGVPQPAALIDTKSSFRAFMNVNNVAFINGRGHCYLYMTKERVSGGEPSRTHGFQYRSTEGATVPPFTSSRGSNQLGETFPTMLSEQEQFNGHFNDTTTPVQDKEPQNVEPNAHQSEDDATTIDRGCSPPRRMHEEQPRDHHEYQCGPRNVVDDEEDENIEDVGARGMYRSSSMMGPSASNQYIRAMPPIPPSTY
ncbi:hypothetical protein OWV82_005789 [Melia azedarach]|uniref:Uncharacterized protein n=1 Tax=Melia azedarach TaxID=155640 RepID=A0ACC1YEN7_MELAZ|nr:hypothetical protein OWV82_005789 [Melia azedarach]